MTKTEPLQYSKRWPELAHRLKESFMGCEGAEYPFGAGFPELVFDPSGAARIFEVIDSSGDRFLASRDGLSLFDPDPVWRVWKPTWAHKEFLEAAFVAAWRELPARPPKS